MRFHFKAPYSSSKAALNNISESLRLELSPFGVSIVTILAGLIETHFHSGNMYFKLRPDSLYAPIKEIIEGWANGKSKPKGQSAEDFAASIAVDILGQGKGGMVWKGPNAGSVKWATKFFPASLIVSTAPYSHVHLTMGLCQTPHFHHVLLYLHVITPGLVHKPRPRLDRISSRGFEEAISIY